MSGAIPAVLDHVAVAFEAQADAWPRYVSQLGGSYGFGAESPGFDFHQLTFGGGMNLEVLSPARVGQNDFLRRFLDHTGPSAHHLTFKVRDLTAALAAVEACGLRPVGVNRAVPEWQEAFLHPKDGPGIVIQLAQPGPDPDGGSDGSDRHDEAWGHAPVGFPVPPLPAAALQHAALAVASTGRELAVFVDLLGGDVRGSGVDAALGGSWTDLAWPGPGRIRLLEPLPGPAGADLRDWLGDRRGRLHHLAFSGAPIGLSAGSSSSVSIPDAVALPGDASRLHVTPERNHGVRLVLSP